jgi:hypothetical protein
VNVQQRRKALSIEKDLETAQFLESPTHIEGGKDIVDLLEGGVEILRSVYKARISTTMRLNFKISRFDACVSATKSITKAAIWRITPMRI